MAIGLAVLTFVIAFLFKNIIYLIHSQSLLTLFEIPNEPKPHSSPLC